MASVTGSNDSHLGLERQLKARAERVQAILLGPSVALLHRLGVSPRAASALQDPRRPGSQELPGVLAGAHHIYLTPALALATLAMAAEGGVALWRLHYVMA